MTDQQFVREIEIRCFIEQIDGYPLGHPCRKDFHPIVPTFADKDGKINRERMMANHDFTPRERALLLNTNPDWRAALSEVESALEKPQP